MIKECHKRTMHLINKYLKLSATLSALSYVFVTAPKNHLKWLTNLPFCDSTGKVDNLTL